MVIQLTLISLLGALTGVILLVLAMNKVFDWLERRRLQDEGYDKKSIDLIMRTNKKFK